jgi:hypothetical protein
MPDGFRIRICVITESDSSLWETKVNHELFDCVVMPYPSSLVNLRASPDSQTNLAADSVFYWAGEKYYILWVDWTDNFPFFGPPSNLESSHKFPFVIVIKSDFVAVSMIPAQECKWWQQFLLLSLARKLDSPHTSTTQSNRTVPSSGDHSPTADDIARFRLKLQLGLGIAPSIDRALWWQTFRWLWTEMVWPVGICTDRDQI